jgi:hypothetical protein
MRLEGLGQLKKSKDLLGNRTRELLDYSIEPQPKTLPNYATTCPLQMFITKDLLTDEQTV